jgi:phospholipid/cholesterol/gamma-HCH transport system ATP-binding protein
MKQITQDSESEMNNQRFQENIRQDQWSPILEMKNVSLSFNDSPVLKHFNLKLYPHEIVAVLGPSGGGKSTIIKLITGLQEPDSGEVIIQNKSLALAFQEGALFTSLTVADNIRIVLTHASQVGKSKNEKQRKSKDDRCQIEDRIDEVLNLVGLTDSKERFPHELSGGMQKRVGIARAIAIQPDIVLYDEPFSGLDPILITRLAKDLQKIHAKTQMAGMVVTHEFESIQKMAHRVALLYDGSFVYEGPVDDFFRTDNEYAKQFREHQEDGPIKV